MNTLARLQTWYSYQCSGEWDYSSGMNIQSCDNYLDPASWRHYLPYLIDYTFRHMDDPEMVVEGLLHNLRTGG